LSLETALNDGKSPGTFQLNPSVAIWQARNLVQLWPGVAWRTRDSAAQPIQPAATEAMQTPIGLLDEPDMARQTALTLDVSRNHVAVFGAAGSGKTNLLRSLLVSLAATHSPAELHAYVLDLGSRAFRSLEQLPHVGAVIYADEERFAERLQRLLELLLRKVEERQRTISDSGAGNFYEYNQQHPEQPLPAILLLIDNMAELQENHEALIENNLIPLARRALGNGLSMVVAANIPANIPSRLYNLFAERITFRQTNPDLYMDIVGRGAVEIGDQPGRGYARLRQQPLLFQAALPIGVAQPGERAQTNEASALAEMALAMRELTAARGLHPLPEPINVLPEQLSLHKILADAKPASAMAIEIVLGWGAQLQPVGLDLQRIAPHVAIIGPPLAGKTTALLSWVLALTSRYSPEQVRVILVDMQRKLFDYGGKRRLNELPHVVATISEQEQLAELVANLEQEAKQLALGTASQQLFVVVDNFDDFNDDLSSQQQQRLALVAKRHGRDGLHFIMATTPEAGANASELRRRILAANLGIGLRTAQAVESLKVLRTPPEVRARELPPGRGYLVRSTIPALLQIASPYEVPETQADNNADVEPAMRNANALDWWVAQICAAYPVIHQSWPGGAANSTKQMATTTDPQMQQRRELLQKGAQRELAAFRAGKLNGHSERPLLVELLLQLNGQEEASALRSMLYEMFLREQEAAGKPRSLISMLVPADDEASIISTIEQFQRVEYGQDPAKEQ
jgi:DNA segregation ATPase FtsK/SpoIIIE, S-DNA-T family